MTAQPRVLQRTAIYQGKVIRVIREVLKTRGHTMVRETIQHPGAVVIVPLLDRSRTVFVRQYRRAIRRELLELPAGTLGRGEGAIACARRELQEETGWQARELRRIGQFYAAPGFISEQLTVFLATQLRLVGAHPDPDEFIQPVILTLETALGDIRSGKIRDAKTIIGLLFVERLLKREAS